MKALHNMQYDSNNDQTMILFLMSFWHCQDSLDFQNSFHIDMQRCCGFLEQPLFENAGML